MPDMLLMESSGPGEARRAIERWRAADSSTEVPGYANNNTSSFISSPGIPSEGAFCEMTGHTAPTVQTIPSWITTQLPGAGCSWPPHSGFILFLLLMESQGRIMYLRSFSSSQCGCGNSNFTFPFSSGWDPGRCSFTSTFSIGTEVLSPCNHTFQGPNPASGTHRRKRERIKKYPKKQICEQPNQ